MKMQTPKNKTANGEGGFTLIETSIAMVVMMVAALACSSLFIFSIQNNVGGSERALSMAVAQQQLEQIRSVTYEDSTLNAGTTNVVPHHDLDAVTTEMWERILRVNLLGTWNVIQAAAPHLRATGEGVIVNRTEHIVAGARRCAYRVCPAARTPAT